MRASEEYSTINRFAAIAPVDVKGLIEALGIQYQKAFLNDNISGMLERMSNGRFKITVNATHKETRQRFTAAHELGHYINHRNLIGDGIDDNKAYRSTAEGMYHNKDIGPLEETEANKFAAIVLMPGPMVKQEYQANQNTDELARKFGVSERALKWRLVNLKLATKIEVGLN